MNLCLSVIGLFDYNVYDAFWYDDHLHYLLSFYVFVFPFIGQHGSFNLLV